MAEEDSRNSISTLAAENNVLKAKLEEDESKAEFSGNSVQKI